MLSPGEAVDIRLPAAPDMSLVRAALDGAPIDAIALPAEGRRKRLLIADMDRTIVTGETLDELADFAGLKEPIAAITERSMNGEMTSPKHYASGSACCGVCRWMHWRRPGGVSD